MLVMAGTLEGCHGARSARTVDPLPQDRRVGAGMGFAAGWLEATIEMEYCDHPTTGTRYISSGEATQPRGRGNSISPASDWGKQGGKISVQIASRHQSWTKLDKAGATEA